MNWIIFTPEALYNKVVFANCEGDKYHVVGNKIDYYIEKNSFSIKKVVEKINGFI